MLMKMKLRPLEELYTSGNDDNEDSGTLVRLAKEFTDKFRKHGEYFQLSTTEDMAVFTNIANIDSSS
jgi:hypothetical protein